MKHKILAINLGNFGSTGAIMREIRNFATKTGEFQIYNCYPLSKYNLKIESDDIVICGDIYRRISQRLGWLTGFNSCFAFFSTIKLIKKIKKIKPDIIHLHNIHGGYVNIKMLFNFFKKNQTKIVWTLHDCWSFTGGCPSFSMIKCEKWKTQCNNCPQLNIYPASLIDNTRYMYSLKKKLFNSISNSNIVYIAPSVWLSKLFKRSFLKKNTIQIINNGINLNIFRPKESSFRKMYNLENKFIILGIAFDWGSRKGFDVFIELRKQLEFDNFAIVLVGTNDDLDKNLPKGIISIHRTKNQNELVDVYSACDLFLNPTREDNFPTVNIEALACGAPVITFRTGGSPEIVDEKTGVVVDCDDIETLRKEIIYIYNNRPYSKKACVDRAKKFDMNDKMQEYIDLYKKICLQK
ncbi:MAG TPA: glycosyltransferase [Erysipelotrichaceae bacterium]|nr:glycosyltransferase [Erysipelotrichaceae bacterium]